MISPTAATARLTRVGRARGTLRLGELSALLVQQLAKAPIARLLAIGSSGRTSPTTSKTPGAQPGDDRLDEFSYRRGQR